MLTIDATAPNNLPALRLDPASDTGVKGDNITSLRRPLLIGMSDPNSAVEIIGPDGSVLASGTADAQGNFGLRLASDLVNGTITLRVRARDVAGNLGPAVSPLTLTIATTPGDYDADGIADLAVYRPNATTNTSTWAVARSTAGGLSQDFGRPGDIPVQGDFDGDGQLDLAVYRPSSDQLPGAAEWLIQGSRRGFYSVLFGSTGLDLPAPADYDGDGITDIATFRPQSDLLPGASQWFILQSGGGGAISILFGGAGLDIPVPADYDGDGKADLAVFRPNSDLIPGAAQWFILQTTDGATSPDFVFGQANLDLPVPADYDGDGRADVAAYRPSTSEWFYRGVGLSPAATRIPFGAPGNVPAPADYDGDGRADIAVFDQGNGQWSIRGTASGSQVIPFGLAGDIPPAAPLAYRDNVPGNVVAPPDLIFGGALAANGSAAAPAGGSGIAAAGGSGIAAAGGLDLGGTASRLATGAATGTPAAAPTAPLTRPAQAIAAGQGGPPPAPRPPAIAPPGSPADAAAPRPA